MWNFFLNNRRFSILIIVVLIGLGLYSVASIPKESAPEVVIPIGIITTTLPGAPAVDVESLVTNELERGLAGALENVKSITSTSRESVSSIIVEFAANADVDESISELRDRIEVLSAELPTDATRPLVSELNFVDQPILTVAFAGDFTDTEFSKLADLLERELEAVSGVSRVEKTGVRESEVSVLVNQTALLNYNLTINEVVNGIRVANISSPIGQIITNEISYNIVFDGNIKNVNAVANIPITARGGQPVFVRDVAEVVIGLAPATSYSRLSTNHEPSKNSFVLSIYKGSGGDVTVISDAVKSKLDELKNNVLLQEVNTYVIQDAGDLIKKDLFKLTTSGLQTIVLVVITLMLMIGWREGLIAGMAIPLSFTIGFIGLYFSGNTINFISLFALILGIGILVDSAIVIVEGINRNLKGNPTLSKMDAGKLTVKEFSSPLIAGTLTTVGMFAGLFIVSGITGQFISSIPFTIIFVLLASLLVALGFIPLIATVFLTKKSTTNTKFQDKQNQYSHLTEDWYRKNLSKIINSKVYERRFLWLLGIGLITAIALIPLGLVKIVFFEQSDVNQIYVEVELPEGSIKERTDVVTRQIEEVLYDQEMIEAFTVTVGSGSMFVSGGQNSKLANIFIALAEERELTSTEFTEELRQSLSHIEGAKITVTQPTDGPPAGAPIGVKLFGDDFKKLNDAANDIATKLAEMEGVIDVKTGTDTNSTEFVFTLNRARAAAVGLTPQSITQTLRSAIYGTTAAEITTSEDALKIVARLNFDVNDTVDANFANRTSIDVLENIEITTPTGEKVLLSTLVDTSLREASGVINHEDQKRVITVSASVASGGNVYEINTELTRILESEIEFPEGVSYSFGGESEESTQAFIELFLALIVGIMLMVAVLVYEFDSYRHTLYVLSILPFSLIGILYGLALTGSALSFPSIMGFIALSGIIINNSILLIDMMNQSRRKNPNQSITEIVIESSVSRLRPIILTSLTTILGMIPLLFTDAVWMPLATAIIFGLLFSVVITLILIPIIYSKWPGRILSEG